MSALLEVRGLSVRRGQLLALRDLSLAVEAGRVVAVIGANGAGKSTLLEAVAGLLRPERGGVVLDGTEVTALPAHRRLRLGIALVPEGRRLFPSLSVRENLLTGQYRRRPGPWDLPAVYALFPWMADRAAQRASALSGGEQQAVALGRALLANPRVLLLDELSLGLAPAVVATVYRTLPQVVAQGTGVLLVEQDVSLALRRADEVHCLLEGRVELSGSPADLSARQIETAYFGIRRESA
ncbi:ATP-binding cassette domain-containing protein [Actinospica durhamensis]|uniref:ATP-binding cassette domain-containing protein n=1 Tax=Actinospica durhamensis TaxID=1508375 RepID=A0A941EPM9_9ACTN|nr:ATP-binding cassette domain-containing protein [Actinospica durhamensis]MBR7834803.1 ATP-binding cassette domain-containing protein [Actinospica durhamensis]